MSREVDIYRVDFYPKDFMLDAQRLDNEHRGAYIQIMCAVLHHQGPVDNDHKWLSGLCGCSPRKMRSIIEALVEKDFLQIVDGKLTQKRAEMELEKARKRSEKASKSVRKSHENVPKKSRKSPEIEPESNKNNDIGSTNYQSTINNNKKSIKKDDFVPPQKSGTPSLEFVDSWLSEYPDTSHPVVRPKVREALYHAVMFEGKTEEYLMDTVRGHAKRMDGRDREFVPAPQNFLKEKQYLDETLAEEGMKRRPVELEDWQEALAERIDRNEVVVWFGRCTFDGSVIFSPFQTGVDYIKKDYLPRVRAVLGEHIQIQLAKGDAA